MIHPMDLVELRRCRRPLQVGDDGAEPPLSTRPAACPPGPDCEPSAAEGQVLAGWALR